MNQVIYLYREYRLQTRVEALWSVLRPSVIDGWKVFFNTLFHEGVVKEGEMMNKLLYRNFFSWDWFKTALMVFIDIGIPTISALLLTCPVEF